MRIRQIKAYNIKRDLEYMNKEELENKSGSHILKLKFRISV